MAERILSAAALAAALLALPASAAAAGRTYANPVLDGNWPDPSAVRIGRTYWTVTTATTTDGLPLLRSPDLTDWTLAGYVMGVPAGWPQSPLWAPELVRWGRGFAVYYAAQNRRGMLCVGVATARSVTGPYRNHGAIQCEPAGAIDPTVARDRSGRPWLLWKEDGNSRGRPTAIWARRLRPDGLHVYGGRRLILKSGGQPWEHGIVEGPEVVRRGGWYYLFYSGGDCCTLRCDYAMGVARSRSLLGPWQPYARNPILRGNRVWRCPGHGSLVEGPRGRWFVVYHAMPAGRAPPRIDPGGAPFRNMLVDELHWTRSGWPEINGDRGPSRSARGPGKRRRGRIPVPSH